MVFAGLGGWALWVFVFVVGSALGSFLNVVIYRLPRADSIISPPSHCFSCGARLTLVDLFPVLSYLFLRGRCRHCGRPYSPRYMLVEAACGILAVLTVLYWGPNWAALGVLVVCLCLVAIMFIDLDHMIIPDELVAIILALGLVVDGARWWNQGKAAAIQFNETYLRQGAGVDYTVYLPRSVVGLLVGAGLLLFLGWVFEKALGKPSMGGGDVKLAGAMGAWLGPGYAFGAYFLLAVMSGAVVGLVVMGLRQRGRRDYIPFGPMLALAGIVMLLWGDQVTPWVIARFSLS